MTRICKLHGVFLCFASFFCPIQCAQSDWDALYDTYGGVSIEESVELVTHCPVSYYFDTHKGCYRVGFIATALNNSYSSYLVNVPRMYRDPEGIMRSEEVLSVDIVSLFSAALPSIQYVGVVAEGLTEQLDAFRKEKDNFALKIIRIAKQTGTEWRTANEIRAAREVLQRRLQSLQQQLAYAENIHDLNKENVRIRHEKRRAMRVEHHERLLSLRQTYEAEMVALRSRRQNESLSFSKEMQRDKYMEKQRMIEEEYRFATEQLMTEIEMSISAIRYRGQEESRVERENEAVTMALLQAKGELQVQRVQAVVDTFFTELESRLRFLFDDPRVVALAAVAVVAILALVVVVTELFNSGKTVLKSLMRRSSLLTQVGTVSASSASSISRVGAISLQEGVSVAHQALLAAVRKEVVLSPETEGRLVNIACAIMRSRESFAASNRLQAECCLPNVLISAPHGNGKSIAAQLLARCAGVEFAVVSGNDLRAQGAGADRSFRNILEACVAKSVKKNKQFMLVIDDVDAIALSQVQSGGMRSPARPGSGRKKSLNGLLQDRVLADMTVNLAPSMKACIHLMLQTFKNSSAFLGLIITSTAPVEALNQALLDRMDHIVCIDPPTETQRLQCCLHQTAALLQQYMTPSDRAEFQKVYDAATFKGDFSILYDGGKAIELVSEQDSAKPGKRKSVGKKSVPKGLINDAEGLNVTETKKQTQDQAEVDIRQCIVELVFSSTNWSYRDVAKTIQSIQCEVLGTDRCLVTSHIWKQEVKLAVQKWGR